MRNHSEIRYRLRPSVTFLVRESGSVVDFFQANTRRTISLALEDPDYIKILRSLDGNLSVTESFSPGELSARVLLHLNEFLDVLVDSCITESSEVAKVIESSDWRRLLCFLGDIVPSPLVLECFNHLQNSAVCVVGLGGIGSWVCSLLAQMGVGKFILVDSDIVEYSNLNRSLFSSGQIGSSKVAACADNVMRINAQARVHTLACSISSSGDLMKIIADTGERVDLLVNCADYPSVDVTSGWISDVCMPLRIPHILAGGYNLHLSLVGPTIIPGPTPCFRCIQIALDKLNPSLVGIKKLTRAKRELGNLAPLAGISASFVVNEGIRVLLRDYNLQPRMSGRRGEYNFVTQELHFSDFEVSQACPWYKELHAI